MKTFKILIMIFALCSWIIFYIYDWRVALLVQMVMWTNNLERKFINSEPSK